MLYGECSTGNALRGMLYGECSTGNALRGMLYGECSTGNAPDGAPETASRSLPSLATTAGAYHRAIPRRPFRRPPSGDRVQLRHVPARRPTHQPELIQPHHRIVAQLEIQPGELGEGLEQLGLFLEKIQGHLGVQPYRELALTVLVARALEGPLQ